MPERSKGADCKSAGGTPSVVQTHPLPPLILLLLRCKQWQRKLREIRFGTLKCSVCGTRNYYRFKNRQKKYKLDSNKFCPKCRKHTEHKESK